MPKRRRPAIAVVAALGLIGCEGVAEHGGVPEAAPRSPPGEPQMVYTVDDIDISHLKKLPPAMVITAKGTTRTGGWDNAELRPPQAVAPEKGIRSFTFVATGPRPDELAPQVVTPIEATLILDPLPDDVVQIKVMAETGEMIVDVYPPPEPE